MLLGAMAADAKCVQYLCAVHMHKNKPRKRVRCFCFLPGNIANAFKAYATTAFVNCKILRKIAYVNAEALSERKDAGEGQKTAMHSRIRTEKDTSHTNSNIMVCSIYHRKKLLDIQAE